MNMYLVDPYSNQGDQPHISDHVTHTHTINALSGSNFRRFDAVLGNFGVKPAQPAP